MLVVLCSFVVLKEKSCLGKIPLWWNNHDAMISAESEKKLDRHVICFLIIVSWYWSSYFDVITLNYAIDHYSKEWCDQYFRTALSLGYSTFGKKTFPTKHDVLWTTLVMCNAIGTSPQYNECMVHLEAHTLGTSLEKNKSFHMYHLHDCFSNFVL